MHSKIILLGEPAWGIEPGYFKSLHHGIINGTLSEKKPDEIPAIYSTVSHPDNGSQAQPGGPHALTFGKDQPAQQTEKKVALIQIQDAITKRSWWNAGTKQIVKYINQALSDPSITGIILDIDSPGGTVDGTEELANVIRDSKKPVVAFVDGMAASAAYWIASQADYIIIASGTTSRVGSIGTLIMHVDNSGYLEQNGIKVTLITADQSTDKVLGNPYEPLSEKALEMFKEQLNVINDTFIGYVKAGRGKKLEKAQSKEDVFTGKMYAGQKALELGLVDKIGSLTDAVEKVIQLAAKSADPSFKADNQTADPESNFQSITNNLPFMKFPKLSAIFSWTKETAENPSVSADDFAKLESALAEKDNVISQLTADKEKAEKDAADAAVKVTELTTESTTQKSQIETLEKWKKEAAASQSGKTKDELNDINQPAEKSYNQASYNKKAGVKA